MSVILTIISGLYFMIPAYFANMAPVLCKKLPFFNYPVDCNYKIKGKQFTLKDIQEIDVKLWPFGVKKHVLSGKNYVYFNTGGKKSFFTTNNFETQIGRQIIFEASIVKDKKLKNLYNKTLKVNKFSQIWRWQENVFEKNVFNTIVTILKSLRKYKKKRINNEFNLQVI